MKRNILVVDDEPAMIDMMKTFLESEGYAVHTASNGEEALEFARNYEVELVISDIEMPKMKGTTLFYELKQVDPFIQIIIMTGNPTLSIIANMLEGGAGDFFIKPIDFNLARQVVNETFLRIDRWKQLRKVWLAHKGKGK